MARFNATFTWAAATDATGYRLLVDGVLLVDKPTVGHQAEIELTNGDHTFSLIPYNQIGDGPISTIVRNVSVGPGAVTGFDVTLNAV